MKVTIVTTSLNTGGSELQSIWLANSLVEKGYKVSFLSLKEGSEIQDRLNKNVGLSKFDLYFSKRNKKLKIVRLVYWFSKGVLNLRKKIKLDQEEHLYISFLFHANLVVWLATLFNKRRSRHIVTIRSDRFSGRGSRKKPLRYLLFRMTLTNADGVVFNSHRASNTLGYLVPNKMRKAIILNAPLISLTTKSSREKQFNKISKFIYVGRYDRLKNLANLVKAISHLKERGFNLTLDLYGQGNEDRKLLKLISELNLKKEVKLNSKLKNVQDVYRNYDALILCSTHEAFPNVIIEAMAQKINVISTKIGDELLISPDKISIITGYEDEDIAIGIKNYIKMPKEEKIELIEKGYSFVQNQLNGEKIKEEWNKFLFN